MAQGDRIDLHLHTTFSDGTLSPSQLLAMAKQAGVRTVAITDHDITEGLPEAMEAGSKLGIEVIPGIEISSRFDGNELHILGYFLDWQKPEFQSHLASLRQSRHHRNTRMIERLNRLGLVLTYEEVQSLAGSDSVGRPHIASMLVRKGYVKSEQEAFKRYLGNGGTAYEPRHLPEPAEVISWIRAVRGIPVLAHPTWARKGQSELMKLCQTLRADGLGGIEVYHSTHTPQQTRQYMEIAKRLNLLITGGSDFHGLTKPDIQIGHGRGDLKVPCQFLEALKKAAAVA